ncbi:MAG: hypothetical protein JW840_05035, partial [Candidatus Thermoplasmatota archaeon]|nr:hypothetical protein [Candidatus Thermoplasmatota archaeon]
VTRKEERAGLHCSFFLGAVVLAFCFYQHHWMIMNMCYLFFENIEFFCLAEVFACAGVDRS